MSGSAYSGRAGPGSATSDFNSLAFMVEQMLAQISTAALVKVVKPPYGADGKTITPGTAGPIGFVDVLPLVNQIDGYGNAIPHGTVHKLSYFRYQSGSGAFISDPVKGDIGKLVVADRDTSSVRATGQQANPGSRRKFDKADGTFFPCTIAGKPTQWFAWLEKGFNLTDAYGNTIVGTANGVLINGALINLAGDVITKAGKDLDKHVHTKVTAGTDNTGPPL